MSKVCHVCNSSTSNPLKKDEVNTNNCYIEMFRKFDPTGNTLSLLVQGDPEAIKFYQEERENQRLLEDFTSSKSRLFQVCSCSKKYFHPDCLIKHCLLSVSFSCRECDKVYSLSFKENSEINRSNESFICSFLLLLLFFAAFLTVGILLFTKTILLNSNEDLDHNNYLLGILLVLFAIIFMVLLIVIIRNRFKANNTNSFVIKDTTNLNKNVGRQSSFNFIKNLKNAKKNQDQQADSSKGGVGRAFSSNSINVDATGLAEQEGNELDFEFSDCKNKDFLVNCISFAKNRLKMESIELSDLRRANQDYLNLILRAEKRLRLNIDEGNTELEAARNRNKEEVVDVMFNDKEAPKTRRTKSINFIKPDSYKDYYLELPSALLSLIDSVHEKGIKRQASYEYDKGLLDYNKLCVKKAKKKNEKKINSNLIFSYNIKSVKRRGVAVVEKSVKKEKVSLMGAYLDKKRKKDEEEAKKKLEAEKHDTKLNKSLNRSQLQSSENNKEKDNKLDKSRVIPHHSSVQEAPKQKIAFLGNYLKKKRAQTGKVPASKQKMMNEQLKDNNLTHEYNNEFKELNKSTMNANVNPNQSQRNLLDPMSTSHILEKKIDFKSDNSRINTNNLNTLNMSNNNI
jgi:hypothetical protein